MSFARQKRLLAGWLALVAPLPLPFSEQAEWLILVLYLGAVALFLRRAASDTWLPNWALNLLGLAYLPILYLDFAVLFRGQAVRPLLHLTLYVLVVKLFAFQRESDKWHAFLGCFFLFLAAMGTSVHPTVVLYLLAYLVLTLLVLARFAYLHVLTSFGHREHEPAAFPLRGFLSVTTLAVVVGAVPLFVFLPRLRTPYIMGRGSGSSGVTQAAGFSDEMSLDVASRVRDNPTIALRLTFAPPRSRAREVRLRAASYDRFSDNNWLPSERRRLAGMPGRFRIAEGTAVGRVHIRRERLASESLPLPEESLTLELRRVQLLLDEGGAVSTPEGIPRTILEYDADLAAEPVDAGVPPSASANPGGTLAQAGVTARMTALAASAMGAAGDAQERAQRLETFLIANYAYTLDFVGRGAGDPIGDFLFRYKSGHCELFASSMVLLLRSQGIPARLVTGFLGGEDNPLEDAFIVRQSNAHAWVEVYLGDGLGWRSFDPTPPSGRPATQAASWSLLLQQGYDFLIYRWDTYVLTYGFNDQLEAFSRLRGWWLRFQSLFTPGDKASALGSEVPAAAAPLPAAAAAPPQQRAIWLLLSTLALAACTLVLVLWKHRQPVTAVRAYTQLRGRLEAHGLPVPDALAPLALRLRATIRFPAVQAAVERIVALYVDESFGARPLRIEEQVELRKVLRELPELLKRSA